MAGHWCVCAGCWCLGREQASRRPGPKPPIAPPWTENGETGQPSTPPSSVKKNSTCLTLQRRLTNRDIVSQRFGPHFGWLHLLAGGRLQLVQCSVQRLLHWALHWWLHRLARPETERQALPGQAWAGSDGLGQASQATKHQAVYGTYQALPGPGPAKACPPVGVAGVPPSRQVGPFAHPGWTKRHDPGEKSVLHCSD